MFNKSKRVRMLVLLIILSVLVFAVMTSISFAASSAVEITDPMDLIWKILADWGFAPVIVIIVEILKRFGLLPDGWAGKISMLLALVVWLAVTVAGVFGYDLLGEIPGLPVILGWIVKIGELILAIFGPSIVYRLARAAEAVKPVPLSRRLQLK